VYSEQKEYLANLILHTSGFDSFVRNMKKIHFEMIRKFLSNVSETEKLPEEIEMYIKIYSCGATELTCDWILGKYSVSAEELAEIFERALPLPIRQILEEKMR